MPLNSDHECRVGTFHGLRNAVRVDRDHSEAVSDARDGLTVNCVDPAMVPTQETRQPGAGSDPDGTRRQERRTIASREAARPDVGVETPAQNHVHQLRPRQIPSTGSSRSRA